MPFSNNQVGPSMAQTRPSAPICSKLWQRQAWPTWALIVLVYSSWIVLMSHASQLSWWLVSPMAAVLLCLHGSVQHELLRGRPSPWRWLNDSLGWMPLSLWIPYFQYRNHHQLHHEIHTITEPGLDPESYYHWPHDWYLKSAMVRLLWQLNYTFIGRMLIGPWLVVGLFIKSETQFFWRGFSQPSSLATVLHQINWVLHLLLVAGGIMWLNVQGIIWWQYIVLCVWPGLSLTLMRSYAEHRPGDNNHRRCVIIEGSWVTRLLFMNVNIHQVHHEFPHLPWFMVYGHWRRYKQLILVSNGGYFYQNYWSLMKQTMVHPKDSPMYQKKPANRS